MAALTGRRLPRPGELLHFSEDPGIVRFEPHVAATARQPEAYVWTVDALNSPCYWFPRQCPRVCLFGDPDGGDRRVHAIEPEWVEAMSTTEVFAYSFAAADFEPFGERPHAFVATKLVKPSPDADWDRAVLRAIEKAETLPRDSDGRVPPVILLSFRPRE